MRQQQISYGILNFDSSLLRSLENRERRTMRKRSRSKAADMSISSLTSLSSEGGGRREAAGADDQARQDARRSSSCNKVSSASDSDETSQDLWRGACSNKDSIAGAGDGRSGQPGRLVKSLLQQGQQSHRQHWCAQRQPQR
mmetsp:Transcript_29775/g.64901  ORF Transcript_29775/g.64901 Transcript_29775/m.64901 type:complete len:141 (-) Transcript_29775:305-727(-)